MPTTTVPQVRFRTIDGLRIRYADSGPSREPTLLLTSPWPESVYAFTPIWSSLAERARLFAIDLPGFGASERRDDLLSPRAMGEFLARLIAEAELDTPHLVAPDVGTSAALFLAAAHPEEISGVIVGTGGAAVPIQLGEPLASWVPPSCVKVPTFPWPIRLLFVTDSVPPVRWYVPCDWKPCATTRSWPTECVPSL